MSAEPQAEFARLVASGGRAAIATVIGPEGSERIGRKLLIRDDGLTEGSIDPALDLEIAALGAEQMWVERSELHVLGRDADGDGGLEVFLDVTHPSPRLLILGAVDYAAALCKLARACEWRPYICDPRSAFATEARFPEAERIVVAWPDAAFAELGIDRATYIAILTHDPKLDDAALRIALRSEAAYVGAMGSRRAQETRHERLTEAGMSEAEIARMAAPIGLDLGATSPEETALSIMAQAVAVRNGRRGGPLSEAEGRIHEIES